MFESMYVAAIDWWNWIDCLARQLLRKVMEYTQYSSKVKRLEDTAVCSRSMRLSIARICDIIAYGMLQSIHLFREWWGREWSIKG